MASSWVKGQRVALLLRAQERKFEGQFKNQYAWHKTVGNQGAIAPARRRVLEIRRLLFVEIWAPRYNELIKQFVEIFR